METKTITLSEKEIALIHRAISNLIMQLDCDYTAQYSKREQIKSEIDLLERLLTSI